MLHKSAWEQLNSTCIWQCKDKNISIKIDDKNKQKHLYFAIAQLQMMAPSWCHSLSGARRGFHSLCIEANAVCSQGFPSDGAFLIHGIPALPRWFCASGHSSLWSLSCNCLKRMSKQTFTSLGVLVGLPTVLSLSLCPSVPFPTMASLTGLRFLRGGHTGMTQKAVMLKIVGSGTPALVFPSLLLNI